MVLNCHLNWKPYWFYVQPHHLYSLWFSKMDFRGFFLLFEFLESPLIIHLPVNFTLFIPFLMLLNFHLCRSLRLSALVSRRICLLFYWEYQTLFDVSFLSCSTISISFPVPCCSESSGCALFVSLFSVCPLLCFFFSLW